MTFSKAPRLSAARCSRPAYALAAQERYPSRTIRVMVPFPAGATTDMLARLIAHRLSETLGQSVVVENVGGGGGSIGADQVAKAAPDGYTLLFGNITFTTTTSSLHVCQTRAPRLRRLRAGLGRRLCAVLVAVAIRRCRPRTSRNSSTMPKQATTPLFYGSTGPGSIMHLCGEVLKRDAGIKMDHVPFRGAAPLVTELLAGRIHFGGDQLSSSLQHVRTGSLKALAVATKSVAMPDVPTVREMGFPNLELQGWNGFLAPKGTPDAVVARLQQEIAAAVKQPEVAKSHDRTSAPSRPARRRRKCATCCASRSPRSGRSWKSSSSSWNRRPRNSHFARLVCSR